MFGIDRESHQGTPVQVRLHKDLLNALEDWRREQINIPTRPEAIRRLLHRSLRTQESAAVEATRV